MTLPDQSTTAATARRHRDKPLAALTDAELSALHRLGRFTALLHRDLDESLSALSLLATHEMADRELKASLASDEEQHGH